MTQRELRNIIVKLLYNYLKAPAGQHSPKVVLSDQVMPEADYPYIYYQSIQQHIPGPYNRGQTVNDGTITKYRSESAQASFSFTACSMNRTGPNGTKISGDDEALNLADRAQGFFLFTGRPQLAAAGVVVVSVENTQSRSAIDGDETDRRYGFDVLLRYERRDERAVEAMGLPITYMEEE